VDPIKLAKLRWACRRGMLELDLLFEHYVNTYYCSASQEEQSMFEALLECNDQELYNWLIKREPAPARSSRMVEILLKYANAES
jgi:antitoxin CptB